MELTLGLPYFLYCSRQAGISAVDGLLCSCPVGDADISAVNIGSMYLKAYIGDHNSLFDLIIKRLMDS